MERELPGWRLEFLGGWPSPSTGEMHYEIKLRGLETGMIPRAVSSVSHEAAYRQVARIARGMESM